MNWNQHIQIQVRIIISIVYQINLNKMKISSVSQLNSSFKNRICLFWIKIIIQLDKKKGIISKILNQNKKINILIVQNLKLNCYVIK